MARIGDPSSKYGYEPHKLDIDIAINQERAAVRAELIKRILIGFIAGPDERERFGEVTGAMIEIKEELGL